MDNATAQAVMAGGLGALLAILGFGWITRKLIPDLLARFDKAIDAFRQEMAEEQQSVADHLEEMSEDPTSEEESLGRTRKGTCQSHDSASADHGRHDRAELESVRLRPTRKAQQRSNEGNANQSD